MKKLIYLILALPLLAAKCEKDQPVVINKPVVTDSTHVDSALTELEKLPPITTTGANTFGCLLNGKAWLPTSGGSSNTKLRVDYFNGSCFVNALIFGKNPITNESGILNSIYVYIDSSLFNTGSFNYGTPGAAFAFTDFVNKCDYYKPETINGKTIITKLDTSKRILSGQFDFVVYGPDNNCDSVVVSDGRFDVKY